MELNETAVSVSVINEESWIYLIYLHLFTPDSNMHRYRGIGLLSSYDLLTLYISLKKFESNNGN